MWCWLKSIHNDCHCHTYMTITRLSCTLNEYGTLKWTNFLKPLAQSLLTWDINYVAIRFILSFQWLWIAFLVMSSHSTCKRTSYEFKQCLSMEFLKRRKMLHWLLSKNSIFRGVGRGYNHFTPNKSVMWLRYWRKQENVTEENGK